MRKKVFRTLKKNSLYNLRLLYLKTKREKYFNSILSRFNNFIKKYAYKFTNNKQKYEDLCQLARIGLWKGLLKKVKKESHLVQNIVYSIKTEVHNGFRKVNMIDSKEDSLYIDEMTGHYDIDKVEEKIYYEELLERLLPHLTFFQRKVLFYLLSGYSQTEISIKLGKFLASINDTFKRIKYKASLLKNK